MGTSREFCKLVCHWRRTLPAKAKQLLKLEKRIQVLEKKAGGKEGSRRTCPEPVWLFGDADAVPNLQMRSERWELLCAKGNWAASRNGVQKVLHAAKEGEEEEGVAVWWLSVGTRSSPSSSLSTKAVALSCDIWKVNFLFPGVIRPLETKQQRHLDVLIGKLC